MNKTIAVVAPGNMGAAVGARLVGRGARVITSLVGRSEASLARARAAGMKPASDQELAAADLLSIVPPDQAAALAARMAACCTASASKTVFIDLNAISPATAGEVGGNLEGERRGLRRWRHHRAPAEGRIGRADLLSFRACRRQRRDSHPLWLDRESSRRRYRRGLGAQEMSYAGVTKGLIALGAGMIWRPSGLASTALCGPSLASASPICWRG